MTTPRCRNGDGRAVHSRGLCRRCWNAQRAAAPPPPRGDKVELGAVNVPEDVARAMRAAAERAGVSLARWRVLAYQERLSAPPDGPSTA